MATQHSPKAIQTWILNRLAADFGLDPTAVHPHSAFESYGLSSRDLVMLSGDLEAWLGIPLSPVLLYEYPSLHTLAAYLAEGKVAREQSTVTSEQRAVGSDPSTPLPIAIVGMACRFPGADGLDAFWELLVKGGDGIREVPDGRWNQTELEQTLPGKNGDLRTRWGGFLDGVDQFDAHFFGIAPREAVHLDPQQRILLETAWDALADAGLPAPQLAGSSTGVFVGISGSEYGQAQMTDLAQINSYMGTGGALSIAANRLSYVFDWHGPSVAVDTACSSSLVAVHLACQSLRQGETTLALAAGTNLILSPAVTVNFSEAGAMAADGRCKSFDARADGYVRSEGVGVVILKPLPQAVADGDRVYAVILGSAVNQDGRTNGLMAPNPRAQEEVLQAAYQQAGVSPGDITYVESHGTGTLLGDPIEAKALGTVLSQGRADGSVCRLGSVKSNLGHLEAAAGVAGLIKTALALHHGQLPPNLHFQIPNPHIPFGDLPLRVQQKLEPWPQPGEKALAGVSSFGFGGSNAHVVLAAPDLLPALEQGQPQGLPLLLSARTPEALAATAVRWRNWLTNEETLPAWNDICYTAVRRRAHLEHRLALVAASAAEAAAQLTAFLAGETVAHLSSGSARPDDTPRLVFVCPGQGSQWSGMARQLWRDQPVFRQSLEQTAVAFRPYTDWDLQKCLFADPLPERIDIIQPLLFAVSVALADLWRSLGVTPGAVVGHSMGEVAAATIAGALTLDDAARVICGRSRLLRQIEGQGLMAVVELTAAEFTSGKWHRTGVSVAAVNSPHSVVLSGEPSAVEALLNELEADNIFCRQVNVTVASHSPQVDALRGELLDLLAPLRPQPAQLPIYSTVNGTTLNGREMDAAYWADNLRQPVLFTAAVTQLQQDGFNIFIELSPHPVLLHAIEQTNAVSRITHHISRIPSGRRDQAEWAEMLAGLGVLHVHGYAVDWAALYPQTRPPISLPGYPWQRERFWFDPAVNRVTPLAATSGHPLLGHYLPLAADRQSHVWQSQLSLARLPYLADHRVQARVIFPAAGYLAMVATAVTTHYETTTFRLDDVRFTEALPLPADGQITTQLTLTAELPHQANFQIAALASEQLPGWRRHASGRLRLREDLAVAPALPGDLAALRRRCAVPVEAGTFYAGLAQRQMHYGPAFQRMTAVWTGEGEALAKLMPLETAADPLHPALLDAAFQTLIAAMPPALQQATAGQILLPVALDHFYAAERAPQGSSYWSYGRFHNDSTDGDLWRGDVYLLDENGELLAAAVGLQARALGAAPGAMAVPGPDHWFYEIAWQEQPLLPVPTRSSKGSWLLFVPPDAPFALPLLDALGKDGRQAILVYPGPHFRQISVTQYELNPNQPEDFRRLLENSACEGIIQGWGIGDGPLTLAALAEGQLLTAATTLHLVQALTAVSGQSPRRLICLTAGAMDGSSEGSLPTTTLMGLARVIRSEHPELNCRTVDLPPQPGAADAAALARECLAGDQENEIALRGGQRFVARLQAAAPTPPAQPDQPVRLQVGQVGLLESLSWQPTSRRQPEAHEVEISVAAAGLNFLDVLSALGNRPDQTGQPVVLGVECAGRVRAVGAAVTHVTVGAEVAALAPHAFGTFAIAPAELVAPKPAQLSLAEAAAIPIAFMTAYYALHEVGRVQPGERVLIHSAATGTGLAAVQVARYLGAEIWATAGSERKRDFLRSSGIERVFDSRSLNFAAEIRELTGGAGLDVVFNSLAGEAMTAGLSLLRPRGRFLEIGKRDIYDNQRLGLYHLRQNISFTAVDLAQIAADDPAYAGSLLRQVLTLFAQGDLTPLPREEFTAANIADAFRQMAQARHVGKIVVTMPEAVSGEQLAVNGERFPLLRKDGTYLITGGLGGIGLQVAAYLAAQGAGCLALLGRRAPSAAAHELIERLQQSGTTVTIFAVDVADEAEITAVFNQIRRDLPPLRGIFHAAGVLDDGLLGRQTAVRFDTVLAPKVRGGWLLHHLSLGDPLDFFVLFSSIAAIFGSPGQGNHAAANAFLDGLAHYRRAQGRPALSINWGAWLEVGAAVGKQSAERGVTDGMAAIAPEWGIAALGQLLAAAPVQMAVTAVDWPRWFQNYPAGVDAPLLAQIAADLGIRGNASGNNGRDAIIAQLHAAARPQERRELLEDFLRRQAAHILRQSPAKIESHVPFGALGFDSLMGLELKNSLERQLGLVLPVSLVWNYPTVAEMAVYMAQQLGLSLADDGGETAVAANPPGDTRAAELAQLSEEDVLHMLQEKLGTLE